MKKLFALMFVESMQAGEEIQNGELDEICSYAHDLRELLCYASGVIVSLGNRMRDQVQ